MIETQYVIFRLGEDLYGATIKGCTGNYPSPKAHQGT